jgi:hypothetical protein
MYPVAPLELFIYQDNYTQLSCVFKGKKIKTTNIAWHLAIL